MFDVALLVLELPHLDDEQVAFPDPHAFLQLARNPAQTALAVRTHDPNPRGPQELVRNSEDFAVLRSRHADPDDLFLFGHSRADGTGWLKRFRVRYSRRSTPSGTESDSSRRVSPTGTYGNGTGGVSKNVGLTMSTPSGRSYSWSSTWPNQYTTDPSPNKSLYG